MQEKNESIVFAKVVKFLPLRFVAAVLLVKLTTSRNVKWFKYDAEKNDAAKNIAELLSRGRARRRDGRSVYNKIYEFEYNAFNQNVKMAMTSVSGHLLALDFVGTYRKWQAVPPVTLFDAPIQKHCPENYQNIKKTLEEETKKSQYLIIWTDCDREGENIGYEVIQVCQSIKPNIRVFRAKFSEITIQSVTRAMQNLEPPNKNVSDAVDVRQELDLRIGAAFTRFQTLRLQQVFPQNLGSSMISYGSCQFPTLGFIVERYKAIQDFVREPFWKIKVVWEPNEEERVDFLWKRHHLFNQLAVQVLLDRCLENPEAEVVKLQTKSKSKWRPLPLDTVEMEKLASRKLRINAKEAMKIAEKLYTQGYISYPRTETNIFPKELDLAPLVEMQTADASWGGFATRVLEEGISPRQGKKSDQAHPPIHPTKYAANLADQNERKLYEFIVRHFLACVSKDAQGFETIAEIQIESEGFVANGLQIVARNYLEVYPYDRWSDKSLPQFSEGQRFEPTSITMDEGETSPPNLLSEADLIALMEKHGIGTDATHAEHIETIKSREYAGVQADGRFLPCSLGMGLVQGYDAMGIALSKPNLRAELEADLKKVCDGIRPPGDVLREQVDKYRTVFVQAMEQVTKIDDALAEYIHEDRQEARSNFPAAGQDGAGAQTIYRKCPSCNSDMVVRRKKDQGAFFISCLGFPDCKSALWLPDSVLQLEIKTEDKCARCPSHPPMLRFKFKPGAFGPFYPDEYEGCLGGCETNFMELLGVRPLSSSNGQSQSAISNRSTTQQRSQASSASSGYFSNNSTGNSSTASNANGNNRAAPPPRTQGATRQGGQNGSHSDFNNRSAPPASQRNQATPATQRRPNPPVRSPTNPGDSVIVCNCNEPAMQLTVRKEGPNTGRQFYKCSKPQGTGCDFFLWADAAAENAPPAQPAQRRNNPPPANNNNNNRNQQDNDNSITNCNCGEPARAFTVNKEGPNKGRRFYSCQMPQDTKCNFFQWAEDGGGDGENGHASHGARGRGRGGRGSRGRGGGGAEGGTRKARKCGSCGQEGHTRNRCPDLE